MAKGNEQLTVKHLRELWEKEFCPLLSLKLKPFKYILNHKLLL